MLKDADGAPVANHNFHDVETPVRGAADLLQPAIGRPPEGRFLSFIDGMIPCPTELGGARLDLDKDEDLTIQDHEVQLIPPVSPVLGQNRAPGGAVMPGRLGLAPTPKCLVRGERTTSRPAQPTAP